MCSKEHGNEFGFTPEDVDNVKKCTILFNKYFSGNAVTAIIVVNFFMNLDNVEIPGLYKSLEELELTEDNIKVLIDKTTMAFEQLTMEKYGN